MKSIPDDLKPEYSPGPGTPMIGPYSTNQMDDFYSALAIGQVKSSGVMNYLQHLYIAERCLPGEKVADVCCGSGLLLPVLYRYASRIQLYVGLDICAANLAEARVRVGELDHHYGRSFHLELHEHDIAQPWPSLPAFDVVVYTSALEHLPRDKGIASLHNTSAALAEGGRMYLSTPNSPGDPPRPLQHRVHVYEWNAKELIPVLEEVGLVVNETIGLLPPSPQDVGAALGRVFGDGASRWFERLRQTIPASFLDTIAASAVPDVALELLYVCSPKPR